MEEKSQRTSLATKNNWSQEERKSHEEGHRRSERIRLQLVEFVNNAPTTVLMRLLEVTPLLGDLNEKLATIAYLKPTKRRKIYERVERMRNTKTKGNFIHALVVAPYTLDDNYPSKIVHPSQLTNIHSINAAVYKNLLTPFDDWDILHMCTDAKEIDRRYTEASILLCSHLNINSWQLRDQKGLKGVPLIIDVPMWFEPVDFGKPVYLGYYVLKKLLKSTSPIDFDTVIEEQLFVSNSKQSIENHILQKMNSALGGTFSYCTSTELAPNSDTDVYTLAEKMGYKMGVKEVVLKKNELSLYIDP